MSHLENKEDAFYLWHLVHTGIIEEDEDGRQAPLWTEARDKEPVTVALIDSGIDMGHPNLVRAAIGPQVDFGPRKHGVVYDPVVPLLDAINDANFPTNSKPEKAADMVIEATRALDQADIPHKGAKSFDQIAHEAEDARDAYDPDVDGSDAAIKTAVDDLLAALPDWETPMPDYLGGADAAIDGLNLGADGETLKSMATGMAEQMEAIALPDPSFRFGAHGTASAGLVCGNEAPEAPHPKHPFYSAMPYFGANPFCKLISYATPYSHEIQPCIRALLAAYLSGAEVILMPRGLPDMATRTATKVTPSRRTRIDAADGTRIVDDDQASLARLQADSALFMKLLKAVAKERYVVLAAGNEGLKGGVSYPASGIVDTGDAIVVGSVNRNGDPSAYTNGESVADKLLWMVSDDGDALDSDRFSVDTRVREGTDYDYTPHQPKGKENTFSPWSPLSLDVRGSYGYAASGNIDPPEGDTGVDRGSLYTLFGGTSAASSLAAGTIALLMQIGELDPKLGLAGVKAAMDAKGLKHFPVPKP